MFHWMDPILGLSRLLLNAEVRAVLVTDPLRLVENVPRDQVAGHFMNGRIAQIVSDLVPKVAGREVIPLFVGMWSDSSGVSRGGEENNSPQLALLRHFLASSENSIHPLREWFYNIPLKMWNQRSGSSIIGFFPDLDADSLPPNMRSHSPEIKAAVFHRCMSLISKAMTSYKSKYGDGNCRLSSRERDADSILGIVELQTSKGNELFFPLLCVYVGDMMELLTCARVRSANFKELEKACYVCTRKGSELSALNIEDPLRSEDTTETIIQRAFDAFRSEDGVVGAWKELQSHSLLPVKVIVSSGFHRLDFSVLSFSLHI